MSDWIGSLNHNWGSRHTDAYAWGQVAGFDGAPDTFLECSTARVRVAGLLSPPLTLVVLRQGDRELRLNAVAASLRARGRYDAGGDPVTWRFRTAGGVVSGEISAPAAAFVTFTYANPPGGTKACLNTKIAAARVEVRRPGEAPVTLRTADRAAFEILR